MSASAGRQLAYLDGWRGLAILTLLIGHFFPVPRINLGTVGVNLFFVLSGLLMARILFVDAVSLRTFYRRRLARIMPAAYFFIFVVLVGHLLAGVRINWRETVAAAAFLNNYYPPLPGGGDMPFGHIWSLAVEEHSYVVLSIVALATRQRWAKPRVLLGALALVSAAAGLWYWAGYTGTRLSLDRWMRTEVSAFGIFISALIMLSFRRRELPRVPGGVLITVMVLGSAMHWWNVPAPVSTIVGVGAFALAVNLLHIGPRWIQAGLSWRPLRQLGLWSFSIYLWQQPFYLYVRHHGLDPVIGVVLGLAAGVLSFYLVERPARNYLNGVRASARADRVAPVSVHRSGPN